MSIIAILFAIMATSMLSSGGQARLRDATKTVQSDIRMAANNSITVSPDLDDPTKTSKAWSLRIPGGVTGSYFIEDYYNDTSGKSSKEIILEGGITISAGQSEDLNLVFNTPFAGFKAIDNVISGNWTPDGDAGSIAPPGSHVGGDMTITLRDQEDNSMSISVNNGTGEVSLN